MMTPIPNWEDRTKTIQHLIAELKSFEDQNLIVMVTDDEGKTFKSVKLVSKGFDDDKVYGVLHI